MTSRASISRYRVAELGALLADPVRAGMLLALMDGTVRPAGELARMAGVAPSTASGHLKKLVEGGLLAVVDQGRHRYFMVADAHVAHLIETLSLGRDAPRFVAGASPGEDMTRARTCYDHLAGRLGVTLFERLRDFDAWSLTSDAVRLSEVGAKRLRDVGLMSADSPHPDLPGRVCVDWTERRFHLGGPLGAWLAGSVFDAGWLRRRGTDRSLAATSTGRAGLRALGVDWDGLRTSRAA
ncbi:MAG: winged helix-turn-helix domain-containing protein [Gammaproteobacteria bacterium]|nr:winged helix-turn-helix domain-containing protein [Gammaproteobacteria bacterium]